LSEWSEEELRLLDELSSLRSTDRKLTPEELELIGINFDPYERSRYWGGKAYITLGGRRMQVSPEFGKVEDDK